MKKIVIAAALGLSTIFAGTAHAAGWVVGPAFKDGWKANFTVAAIGGLLDPDTEMSDSAAYGGVEVSLDCPWFQPPTGTIRQQFWIGRYEDNGVTLTSFEVNPRYFIDLDGGWSVGFGPGFGYVEAETPYDDSVGMGSLQAGGDLHYRSGALFFGVGARYMFTENKNISANEKGADNWAAVAKVGFNF